MVRTSSLTFCLECPRCRRARWHYYTAELGPQAAARSLKGHPRCRDCEILSGEGHVEINLVGGRCYSCHQRFQAATPEAQARLIALTNYQNGQRERAAKQGSRYPRAARR